MRLLTAAVLAALTITPVHATGKGGSSTPTFVHIGTFDVTRNPGSEVAEIVASTWSGRTLVYTDSDAGLIGFVDIRDPAHPRPDGVVPVGGEPTSVAVFGRYALAGINTSTIEKVTCEGEDIEFITDWSGKLAVIDIWRRKIVETIDLSGQPDSVAVSHWGGYAAVVIENERNEDVGDGLIPQGRHTEKRSGDPCDLIATGDPRPGVLEIVEMRGRPAHWTTRTVDLTGLPGMFAASDPEPEYVDINGRGEAVVTLQENNHIAVVDLKKAEVKESFSFSAGAVDLQLVDATEEELGPQENGLIEFVEDLDGKRREPDAVAWISNEAFATANEGDYEDKAGEEGGSRGFTIFQKDGDIEFEAFESFEYASASAGHYNEGRSANKGGEPEAVEYGKYRHSELLFVAAERANVIGVYDVGDPGEPKLLQLLPTGIGPEGLLAITRRSLFVVANEVAEDGVPSLITLYRGSTGSDSAYPQLESDDTDDGTPIPWVAMSGLAGDPEIGNTLYGVSDSFLAKGFLYAIDVSGEAGFIFERTKITDPNGFAGGDQDFFPDLEGVAVERVGDGIEFWLASEGRKDARPNAILRVNEDGELLESIELPADLVAGATNSGFEGVALSQDGRHVYAVVQREWNAGDDGVLADPEDRVKIARWDRDVGEWTFVAYQKAAPTGPGWVGLSEITLLPDGTYAIIERDNQLGTAAAVKKVYGVDLESAPFTDDLTVVLPVVEKVLLADLLPDLEANSVWTPDKLEGLSVSADGDVHVVTDNDGLDDAIGQTVFLHLGHWTEALSGDEDDDEEDDEDEDEDDDDDDDDDDD